MKNIFFLIAIIAISIIAIFSCRKSTDPEVNPNQAMNPSTLTEHKIQSFLERMKSDLKDEKTYSVDSAIWYSTAYLNYTYAIYDSALLYLMRDTSLFSIELDRDLVCESDIENAIENMVDSLTAFFEDIPTNTKHLAYCLVYEISIVNDVLNLGLVSVVGYGYSSVYYGTFGQSDYWFSILDSGRCDIYHLQDIGFDATDQLEYHIMHPLVVNDPQWRIYTIPEEIYTTDIIYPVDYPYTPSPRGFRGFTIEGSGTWNGPQCLPPSELNFYISCNGIPYIIDDNQPPQQGQEFIAIDVDGDVAFPWGGYIETHFYTISYALKHRTIVPANSL